MIHAETEADVLIRTFRNMPKLANKETYLKALNELDAYVNLEINKRAKNITGINSRISELPNFSEWCEIVANQVLAEKIISRENFAERLEVHIRNNEAAFYNIIRDDLQKRLYIVKKEAQIWHNKDQRKYTELGFKISSLNARIKKYNIERTKAFQRNEYAKLKAFLQENGHEEIFNEFKEQL